MFSPHNLAVPRLSQPRTYRTQAVRQCRTQKVWHCRTQTAWHCHTQTVRHCCSIARGMVQQCREHTEYIPTLLMCINETTMSVKIGNCENTQRNAIFKRGSVQHCCTSPQISRTLSWGILQTSIHGDLGVNAAILWWHNEVNVLRLCWYCYDHSGDRYGIFQEYPEIFII